ncbi:MAG TPA: acylneuraminate cytidylyltransferase family protein, partial [Tabrizicola sp.]
EHVGMVYVVDPAYLRTARTIYEGRVIPYVLPAERCHDIDTPYDFRLVEFLLSEQLKAGVTKA